MIQIIAELAWAHDGSIGKALKILDGIADSSVNYFNIHITDLDSYMVRQYGNGEGRVSAGRESKSIFNYLKNINISREEWVEFASEVRARGILLSVMPNDLPSLEFALAELKPELLIVSASSFGEMDLIDQVGRSGLPVALRVGGSTLDEISDVILRLSGFGVSLITLLHGHQNYPTRLEDMNVKFISTLRDLFAVEVGLADHIDAETQNVEAQAIPLMALSLGATMIEKHVTFDRAERGEDFESALNPGEFKSFCDLVRAGEAALGSQHWIGLSESEVHYRRVARKKIVAARPLDIGEVLTISDIAFKRSDSGAPLHWMGQLIGKKLKNKVGLDQGISVEDVC